MLFTGIRRILWTCKKFIAWILYTNQLANNLQGRWKDALTKGKANISGRKRKHNYF